MVTDENGDEYGAGVEVYLYEKDTRLETAFLNNQTKQTYSSNKTELSLEEALVVFEDALRDFGFFMEGKTLLVIDKDREVYKDNEIPLIQ